MVRMSGNRYEIWTDGSDRHPLHPHVPVGALVGEFDSYDEAAEYIDEHKEQLADGVRGARLHVVSPSGDYVVNYIEALPTGEYWAYRAELVVRMRPTDRETGEPDRETGEPAPRGSQGYEVWTPGGMEHPRNRHVRVHERVGVYLTHAQAKEHARADMIVVDPAGVADRGTRTVFPDGVVALLPYRAALEGYQHPAESPICAVVISATWQGRSEIVESRAAFANEREARARLRAIAERYAREGDAVMFVQAWTEAYDKAAFQIYTGGGIALYSPNPENWMRVYRRGPNPPG